MDVTGGVVLQQQRSIRMDVRLLVLSGVAIATNTSGGGRQKPSKATKEQRKRKLREKEDPGFVGLLLRGANRKAEKDGLR